MGIVEEDNESAFFGISVQFLINPESVDSVTMNIKTAGIESKTFEVGKVYFSYDVKLSSHLCYTINPDFNLKLFFPIKTRNSNTNV